MHKILSQNALWWVWARKLAPPVGMLGLRDFRGLLKDDSGGHLESFGAKIFYGIYFEILNHKIQN